MLCSFVPSKLIPRVLPASIPVSHSTHFNVLSEPLVPDPFILGWMDPHFSSNKVQGGGIRHPFCKGTDELPPFWDNGAVVRGVGGIFSVSVTSEVEFSQLPLS